MYSIVKEKLVELFFDADQMIHLPYAMNTEQATRYIFEQMADHLIANGVTVQEWIPVSEPPEEHDSIWAKLYGTKSWQPGLFRKCSYDVLACVEKKDGSRRVISIRTYDGKWDNNKLHEYYKKYGGSR